MAVKHRGVSNIYDDSNTRPRKDNMAIENAKNMGHDELADLLKAFSGQMPKLETLLRKLQYR